MMEEVSYYIDRKYLVFRLTASLFLIACCFVVLTISLAGTPSLFVSSLLTNVLDPFLSVISLLGIFFFSFGVFHPLKIMLYRLPALTIQDAGIVANSSAFDAGFVPFDAISNVYTKQFLTDTYICIQLHDEKAFLKNTFFLKKWIMLVNKKLGFECILLQLFPGLSNSEIEEVAESIRDRKNFYKQKRKILLKED